jgi:hypothetical protein
MGHVTLREKYRLSTTISMKHYAMLKTQAEKYETQQKAIELALESLANDSKKSPAISEEDQILVTALKEIKSTLIIFQKDCAKMLLETANIEQFREYTRNEKPIEFAIEYYYHKPIKECTLKEIIDAIIINIKVQNSADLVNCKENNDYYTINITHSFGINMSKMSAIMHESVFNTCGVKFESHISERSIFFKIYKN